MSPKSFAINPFAQAEVDLDHVDTTTRSTRRASFCSKHSVPHGDIVTHEYISSEFSGKRTIKVYLPPEYDEDETTYPVLYLLHPKGQNNAWISNGEVANIVDNLIDDGQIEPLIVAMPIGNLPFISALEDEHAAIEADRQVRHHILDEVVAEIEGNYAAEPNGLQRALAGASDAAYHSLNVGLNEIETFGWVGSFGGAISSNDLLHYFQVIFKDSATGRWKLQLLWFGAGNEDKLAKMNQPFIDLLTEHKFDFEQESYRGGHDWGVWRQCLRDFLCDLFTDLDFFDERS